MDSMQITVFGANGRVGSHVVEEALKAGYRVVAFVHGTYTPPVDAQGLTIVQGDIYSAKEVLAAVKGSDAVVSALGSWGTPSKDILTAGMRNIIPAMEAHSVQRVVSLTGADSRMQSDKKGPLHRLTHVMLGIIAPRILKDSEEHLRLLEQSQLNWTVVRSPVMNEHGSREYVFSMKRPLPWVTAHRFSVASSMVALIPSKDYSKLAPFIKRA